MSTFTPRTARVSIYQGDDLDRLQSLDGDVTRAEVALRVLEKRARDAGKVVRTLADDQPTPAAVTAAQSRLDDAVLARDEFAAEAETRAAVIVLRAVHRRRWRNLIDAHPPRRDDAGEFVAGDEFGGGVNVTTFPDALLKPWMARKMIGSDENAGAIVVEECGGIEGDVMEFVEDLGDYDYYDRLFLTAWNINRGSADADPTRRLASVLSRTSAETSN